MTALMTPPMMGMALIASMMIWTMVSATALATVVPTCWWDMLPRPMLRPMTAHVTTAPTTKPMTADLLSDSLKHLASLPAVLWMPCVMFRNAVPTSLPALKSASISLTAPNRPFN